MQLHQAKKIPEFKRSLLFIVIFWSCYQFALCFRVYPNIDAISSFYPAPALTLALIYYSGWRYLPVVLIAAIWGSFPHTVPWSFKTFIWFNNLRQVLVYGTAALIFSKVFSGRNPFLSAADLSRFMLYCLLTTLISATAALAIYAYFHVVPARVYSHTFCSFMAGDMAGILMFSPLAFLISGYSSGHITELPPLPDWRNKKYLLSLGISAAIAALVFGGVVLHPDFSSYTYLFLIPVVWTGVYFGTLGGSVAVLLSNVVAAGTYALAKGDIFTPTQLQITFTVSAMMTLLMGSYRDDRLRLEEKNRQQTQTMGEMSRFASLGELSGTITHELATPLQTALLNVQMSLRDLQQGNQADLSKILLLNTEAESALKRINNIQYRIRKLAQRNTNQITELYDLKEHIAEALDMLQKDLNQHQICVLVDKVPDITVKAEPTGVMQLYVNLLKNAIQALAETDIKDKKIHCQFTLEQGYLHCHVLDNGKGISSQVQGKLFNSFVTGRPDGLGLGLSICRSIVESFGGHIRTRETKQGAHFCFTLPLVTQEYS